MKTIIAGSRSITDIRHVYDAVRASGFEITEVVSGKARGVDTLGEWFAIRKGIPFTRFEADWSKEGSVAGYNRNQRMGDYGEALIAVWDGRSVGTAHMIGVAFVAGLRIYVHVVGLDICVYGKGEIHQVAGARP